MRTVYIARHIHVMRTVCIARHIHVMRTVCIARHKHMMLYPAISSRRRNLLRQLVPWQRLFDPNALHRGICRDAAAATFGCHPSGRYNIRVIEAFYAEAFTATEDKCLAPRSPVLGVSLTKDISETASAAKFCTLDLSAFEPKQRQCAGLEDSTKSGLIVFYTCESIHTDCKNHQGLSGQTGVRHWKTSCRCRMLK
ncbi:hypothetical protein BV898_19578 [Hypsibius exemplaris]|uniref:Uncharacterized protein n=1 Tax=Hypsibius exemplaris TaxID=2072580 RepID=A0A9X6RPS0_HYPEX|nr:hypothetical protein BV898_19578 [Hypsibius exemplaris]